MPLLHPNSDSEFNNVLLKAGTTPVIVDFFATWWYVLYRILELYKFSGPCNMIAPFFNELSTKYPQLTYAKVDGDKLKGLLSLIVFTLDF